MRCTPRCEARARADRQAVKVASAQLLGRLDGLGKTLLDSRNALSRSTEELFRPWRVLSDPALKTPEAWDAKRKELGIPDELLIRSR